jgi:hypothetical protein
METELSILLSAGAKAWMENRMWRSEMDIYDPGRADRLFGNATTSPESGWLMMMGIIPVKLRHWRECDRFFRRSPMDHFFLQFKEHFGRFGYP